MRKPNRPQDAHRPHRQNRHANPASDLPRLDEDDLLDRLGGEDGGPALLLVLDGVQDPHNLGACLRSANAAGVAAVIAPKDRAVPLTETARQIACGAAEHTPFVQVTNLARFLEKLKAAGFWIAGTSDQADRDIYDLDLTGRIALVMGAEGKGIRRLTGENCDWLIRIPMLGQVECLNVSVATGVCLFEAVRQRNRKGNA